MPKESENSNNVFDKFFEYSIDLLCIADIDGNFVKLNPEWEKTLGYSATELEGKPYLDYVHPDDIESTIQASEKLSENKPIENFQNRYRHKDGSYRWLEWRSFPLNNKIYASARDVTKLKQDEEDFLYINNLHHTVLEAVTLGIVYAKESKIEWCNPAFLKMFNYTFDEIKGQHFSLIFKNKEEYDKLYHAANEKFRKEELFNQWVEVKDFGNSISWINLTGKAISPKSPKNGTVWMIQDITEKKNNEDFLKMFKASVDMASDAIYWQDKDANFYYANEKGYESLGYTKEEILKMSVFDINPIYPKEAWQKLWEDFQLDREKGRTGIRLESHHLCKDGSTFPIEVVANHIWIGDIEFHVSNVRDITERKQNENALLKNQRMLSETQRIANIGSWELNLDDNMLLWSKQTYDIFGVKDYDKQITLNDFFNYVHPDDRENTQKLLEKTINKKVLEDFECRIVRDDNITKTILAEGELLFDENNKPNYILGAVFDITDSKKTEEQLIKAKERAEESEFFLQESQRTGNIGSYKMSFKSGYWISTETLDRIFGIDETFDKNVTGWLDIVHPEDREMMAAYFQNEVISKQQTFNKEYKILRKNDKKSRWVHGMGKLYFDVDGNLSDMLGTIQDITERKQIEEERNRINKELERRVEERTVQLQQLNKDLEAFAYSISHDLRAPLRHINGYMQLMRNVISPMEPKVLNYFDKISVSAKGMSVMIDELLKFSRLGRATLNLSPVSLTDIVNKVIQQFEPDYKDRNIEWGINDLPVVKGDEALLKLAFENLISNAIKYTSKEEFARIEIGICEKDKEKACVFVKDNGVGFDIAYKDKLFGVFQRLHKEADFEGIGVGLANVNQIIKKHNGHINVNSEVNKGTTFYITLPVQ